MGMLLACTGNLDKVTFSGNDPAGNSIPYPGTPEWTAMPPGSKSAWNLLPYMTDSSTGAAIGESGAIARYFVKKFGLAPDDLKLYATSQQSMEKTGDIHAIISGAHYQADRTAAMDALFAAGSRLHNLLAGLEATFAAGDGPFVGNAATPGDYMLAAGLMQCTFLQPDILDGYPRCKRLHDHVHSMEAAQAYLKTVPYGYFKRTSD